MSIAESDPSSGAAAIRSGFRTDPGFKQATQAAFIPWGRRFAEAELP
jgi:hypothetical protein